MLVVDHSFLYWLKTPDDKVLNLTECITDSLLTILRHHVEFHRSQVPLTSQSVIIVVRSFLNSYICQMDVVILDIFNIIGVSVMGKPTKASSVQVNDQRLVRNHEHINSHIELLASNQQRVHDVPLHDVRLSLRGLRLPPEIVLPLGDLSQFIEQENAPSLRLSDWLHDPHPLRLFEFFHKQWIISRKIVSCGKEIIPKGRRIISDLKATYMFASSHRFSFSRFFLNLFRFFTIRSFRVNS